MIGSVQTENERRQRMPRYIDTDEFEKRIKPYDTDDNVDKALYNFALNKMLSTPTANVVDKERYDRLLENSIIISEALNKYQSADMVEVVRCENCMECETRHTANYLPFLFCKLNEHSVSHNAYCCWGRRKESDNG